MEDGEVEEGPVPVVDEDRQGVQFAEQCKLEESPYEILQNCKASVEKIIAEMLSVKKEAQPKSQLRELVTQMFLNFVTLRQANRFIFLEEDRVKMETEHAKAPVDFTSLQLHNLMYEKSHYVKAIKACENFKSKYPDIELVTEEEFFRDATEDIKRSMLSNDSAHNLMLKRLNFELFQRKELCKLHDRLEQQKKSLLEAIANRKKFLSSLPSLLKSLKKASLPVQNQLGVLQTRKLKQHHSAEMLPPPLYVIYSQLLAQKEAFGESIDLEIIGSVKDAQAFSRHQAQKDTVISTTVETSKLEDDAPDEVEDGQSRRKRRRGVQGKESLYRSGILQDHPLKISLHVYDDEVSDPKSAKLITLKFEYLVKLNIVCVGIEGSSDGPNIDILCNLFPDDKGIELPHQSAKLIVGDALIFNDHITSRPYKWAQHLAGIDFLPEVSPLLLTGHDTSDNSEAASSEDVMSGLSLYHQQKRVQTVLQRIRSRRKAQLAFHFKKSDSLLDTESEFSEPAQIIEEPVCDHCFRKSEFLRMDYGVKKFCLVLGGKISEDERNEFGSQDLSVDCGVPSEPPLFALSLCCIPAGENYYENHGLEWYNELRTMEAEVNLHMLKMLPIDQQNYVVANQTCCLAMLFDNYLDETSPSERRNCISAVDDDIRKFVSSRFLGRSLRIAGR